MSFCTAHYEMHRRTGPCKYCEMVSKLEEVTRQRDNAGKLSEGFEADVTDLSCEVNDLRSRLDSCVALLRVCYSRMDLEERRDLAHRYEAAVRAGEAASSTAEREPCGAFVSNDPDLHCRLENDHDGDHEWISRRDGEGQ